MPDASLWSVMLLGLLFGIQHATDPDHVVAVATIVARTRRFGAGALVGAFWGVGHTVTVTAVGIAIVVFNLALTPRVALSLEMLVAIMLIALGVARIVWVFRDSDPVPVSHLGEPHAHGDGPALHSHAHAHAAGAHRHPHAHPPVRLLRALQTVGPAQALRSALVGLVHGLAGSAAVALLVLSTIRGTTQAIAYLLVFGAGTILGMTAITGVLSLPFTIRAPRLERSRRALTLATGALSLGFGLYMVGLLLGRIPGGHPGEWLVADSASHEAGHEDHHHHDGQLDVVVGVQGGGHARVDGLPAAELDAPPDERDHRADLEQEHEEEQRHLRPEERRVQVEVGALLEAREGTEEAGDDPQQRRDAPHVVGGQQPAQPVGVERTLERAPAQEDRGQPDRQRQQVQGRDHGGEHG